jgi:hypothetical protein
MIADCVRRGVRAEDGLVYYDEGEEFVSVTGGWVAGASQSTGSQAKNADNLYLTAGNASAIAYRTYVTDNEIDLTNINSLKIEWANTGASSTANQSRFYVHTNKNDIEHTVRLQKTNTFGRITDTIDVSSLSGNYYVKVSAIDAPTNALATSTISVYKIWGEE